MKKRKVLSIIQYILWIIAFVLGLILGIIFKSDERFYYSVVLIVAVSGLVNLIFIMLKEVLDSAYDSKRFSPVIYVLHVIFGVLGYYLIKYVGHYDSFAYLYWIGIAIGFFVPIGIGYFLNHKNEKKQKNNGKPRVIINKQ